MTGTSREITVAIFTRQGETLAGLFAVELIARGLFTFSQSEWPAIARI